VRAPTALMLVAVVAGLVLAPASPALACDDPEVDEFGELTGECLDAPSPSPGAGNGGTTTPGQSVGWTPPDGWDLATYRVQAYEDDGAPCIREESRYLPDDQITFQVTTANTMWFLWYDRLTADGSTMEWCTGDPGEPALDPEMVRQVIVAQLPLPAPAIDPGRAITGLRSYLDVGAPTSWGVGIDGDILPIRVDIDATAQYRVDWGDGTVATYASSGGPYPDGDITHVYSDAGDLTVTVTPIWTVSWVGGGLDVTFTAELAPSTVDLPVGEVQSVRTD
jgi:hypothetical protein